METLVAQVGLNVNLAPLLWALVVGVVALLAGLLGTLSQILVHFRPARRNEAFVVAVVSCLLCLAVLALWLWQRGHFVSPMLLPVVLALPGLIAIKKAVAVSRQ